jgi:hypothetical protein
VVERYCEVAIGYNPRSPRFAARSTDGGASLIPEPAVAALPQPCTVHWCSGVVAGLGAVCAGVSLPVASAQESEPDFDYSRVHSFWCKVATKWQGGAAKKQPRQSRQHFQVRAAGVAAGPGALVYTAPADPTTRGKLQVRISRDGRAAAWTPGPVRAAVPDARATHARVVPLSRLGSDFSRAGEPLSRRPACPRRPQVLWPALAGYSDTAPLPGHALGVIFENGGLRGRTWAEQGVRRAHPQRVPCFRLTPC